MIDEARRAMLTEKYGTVRPPQADNPIVTAILDGERIAESVTGQGADNWLLCDPSRSPAMYGVVTEAHRDLRAAMARGEIAYDTAHEAYEPYDYDPDKPELARVLIHFVGSRSVLVCRRPDPVGDEPWFVGRPARSYPDRGPAYLADMLSLTSEVYDLWLSDDCNINVADDCGGRTIMFPLTLGAVVLIFRCCWNCQAKAGVDAEVGYRLSEIEAHERTLEAASAPATPTRPSWWTRVRRWIRRA